MVNQQLVDYVKQQTQAGVSKDAVRKALSDAGWPPADVDDSMKALDAVSIPASGAVAAAKPAATTIDPAAAMSAGQAYSPAVSPMKTDKFFDETAVKDHGRKTGMVPLIVMGAVIVLLLGALVYMYFSGSGAVPQVASPDTANLAGQVQSLTADKSNLASQVETLTNDNQAYAAEVAFFAYPTGTSTADITGTIKGTLSGGGAVPYAVTTPHGLKAFVKNYKDAKVDAALKPLVGNVAELSGTHKPGSPDLTVTSVNGVSVNPPPAATSSPTSTPGAAAPAPVIPPAPATP